jgi:hypothetical protein
LSSPEQIPNAVDIAQASELTGLSKKALRRRLERGTLESTKAGGKRMISISELASHGLLEGSAAPEDDASPPPEPAPPESQPASTPPPSAEPAPTPRSSTPPPPASTGESVSAVSPSPPDATPPATPLPAPVQESPASYAAPTPPAGSPAPPPVGVPAMDTAGYPPGQLVPEQAGPGYVGPAYPQRGAWYYWYKYPALRWLAVLLVLAVIGLLVWLLAFRSDDGGTAAVTRGGAPVGVTQEDLIALSQQLHQPIYWAGTMPGTRMELTETDNSYAYIRYLTADAPVGDSSPEFLTVGTYPALDAYKNLTAYANHSRATTKPIQNGGVAVVIPGSPTSVYFAYPHEDVQVEVYDPQPQRALDLVKSGVVRPVTGSTSAVSATPAPATPSTTVPTTTTAPTETPEIPPPG